MLTRRSFNFGLTSAAFGGLALAGCVSPGEIPDLLARIPDFRSGDMRQAFGYGPLVDDRRPRRLLDLPEGFSYEIISSREGRPMDDGSLVPDNADGMGSFVIDDRLMVLVRNHESTSEGGTTTIVYDYEQGEKKEEYRSLAGTRRNCAGGVTPWGSWMTCEEDFSSSPNGDHGFVFDVPALRKGLIEAKPLNHLGRFEHEAVAVDPVSKITYLTEDRVDSLFYRYVPPRGGDARHDGGELQALAFAEEGQGTDSRNWGRETWPVGAWRDVIWKPLDNVAGGRDDLRKRGHREQGAVRFACGEGIHFGDGELYFTCTSGGGIRSGQIFRYVPAPEEGGRDRLQLFLESTDPRVINFADNLVVAPNGHLIVCEDPYFGGEGNYLWRPVAEAMGVPPPCYLRGVTPDGQVYDLARLHGGSELAGACFSPNGKILFVNVYSPAATLAIRGDWKPGPRPGWRLYPAQAAGAA